jgi:NADH:ubiquinone oxidoreductase subunit F (NADH-binding)
MAATEPVIVPPGLAPDDPARLTADPPTTSLDDHLARYGALPRDTRQLIAHVEQAGLRGRGGAGFPTATKLSAVAAGRRAAVVVVNGTEGEPLSAKDKTLLRWAPHLVLDGAVLAARATKAREVVVCIERGQADLRASLDAAIRERRATTGQQPPMRLAETPSRYVAGEESALVHWINGGDAKPTFVPPRPFERGVRGRPTLVDNVETLAHIALIARFGPEWYRALGTPSDPGTRLLTLSGAVTAPGVYEVPGGTSIAGALHLAGGELPAVDAVLVGGYFGTWISNADAATVSLDPESLASVESSPGCGALFALPAGACGLAEAARVTRWLANQNAGQCGPCVYGLDEMARAMDELVAGRHAHAAWEEVGRLMGLVAGRGACKHPDGVVRFVHSSLRTFRDHAAIHAQRGPCPPVAPLLPTPKTGGWR